MFNFKRFSTGITAEDGSMVGNLFLHFHSYFSSVHWPEMWKCVVSVSSCKYVPLQTNNTGFSTSWLGHSNKAVSFWTKGKPWQRTSYTEKKEKEMNYILFSSCPFEKEETWQDIAFVWFLNKLFMILNSIWLL